jgi:hypothetical protein
MTQRRLTVIFPSGGSVSPLEICTVDFETGRELSATLVRVFTAAEEEQRIRDHFLSLRWCSEQITNTVLVVNNFGSEYFRIATLLREVPGRFVMYSKNDKGGIHLGLTDPKEIRTLTEAWRTKIYRDK